MEDKELVTSSELGSAWNVLCGTLDDIVIVGPEIGDGITPKTHEFPVDAREMLLAIALDHEKFMRSRHVYKLTNKRFQYKTMYAIADGIAIGIKVGLKIAEMRLNRKLFTNAVDKPE